MLRIWGLTGHLFGRAIIIRGYMGVTWEQSEVGFGGPNLNSSTKGAGYQNGLHEKWTRSTSGKRDKGCWMYNERRDTMMTLPQSVGMTTLWTAVRAGGGYDG